MKITKKHFEIFKQECQKWIDRMELNNWKVYFEMKDFGDKGILGDCDSDLGGYVATLTIAKEWKERKDITKEAIEEHAKHEVLHLLLARISAVGRSRYIGKDEHYEAEEELVRKLTKIIQDPAPPQTYFPPLYPPGLDGSPLTVGSGKDR